MCVINGKYYYSQISTYHPNGMLDRDQRTTKTINSKFHQNNRSSATVNTTDHQYNSEKYKNHNNCSKCDKSTYNSANCINNNINNYCKYTKDKSLSNSSEQCQITVLSNFKCSQKKDLLLETNNDHKKLVISHSTFSYYKRTKFNSLLICVCFWLLILQKTRAFPVKMAEENNHHHEGSLKCSDVRGVIEKILQQSNLSYEINYNRLENYTQAVFSENHKNHHNMWRRKHFEWLFPNGEPLKLEDYDKQPPEEATQHLRLPGAPSREELTHELINLYQRLKILAMAFENIRRDHENHLYEIMDNKHPSHHIHIMEYFKQQNNYVQALLRETKDGMRQLGIQEPDVINQIPEYNGVRELRDWIVTREHLKLLNYVLKAYEILSNRCT